MTAMAGTFPIFHPHDVVLPHGAGSSYIDLVDELRRNACRHIEEDKQTELGGPTSPSTDEG